MRRFYLLILTIILAAVFANMFGKVYGSILGLAGGFSGFIVPDFWGDFIDGISRAYIFFLLLIFTTLGSVKKYWWIGVLLIPAAAFELYFDSSHIYFPIALGLIGWGIGLGILRLSPGLKHSQ